MSVLQLLDERDDLYPFIHVHLGAADVRSCVITQDVYVCVAPRKTTYSLAVMRRFQDSFAGFKISRAFAINGSRLTLAEVERTERTRASIRDLQVFNVDVHGTYGYDEEELQRLRHLEQRFHVRLMPSRRLLHRHPPGNYQPPDRTGDQLVDRLTVMFRMH